MIIWICDLLFIYRPDRDDLIGLVLKYVIIIPKGTIMKIVNSIDELGRLIQQTRKEQGMTQDQLAAVCGFGARFIRELEHGKPGCQIGKVFIVLDMLGLKLSTVNRNEIVR
jgi:y4mF family transcriptional regulator